MDQIDEKRIPQERPPQVLSDQLLTKLASPASPSLTNLCDGARITAMNLSSGLFG